MTNPGPRGETSIGGAARDFPATHWSRLLGSFQAGRPRDREAGEDLARRYWKPIYAYIRARAASSNEDAKDLTQDFFLWMLESDFLEKPDPARGRFRGLVKTAVAYYLLNEAQKWRREKRGGGRPLFSIEETPSLPSAGTRKPDDLLDEVWRNELFARAAAALEEDLRRDGKEHHYRLFREVHLLAAPAPAYRELAARHAISETEVSNALARTKERFRGILTDLVAETVRGPEELRDELRSLFGRDPR